MYNRIDLIEWQAAQQRANRYAADLAMWRLGQRYGWNVPHPSYRHVRASYINIANAYRNAAIALAEWFVPRYEALARAFEPPARSPRR